MKLSQSKEITKSFVEHNLALPEGSSNADYLVPMLWSLPGTGKTTAVEDLAKELGMKIETVIAAQFDAGEMGGFPIVDEETNTFRRARPFFLPTSDEPCILFFDELPQAPTANQNIIAQCVNERRIGEHQLPSNVTIVCAGNPMTARAGTNPMPTHLRDRLTHLDIETDHGGFREYALNKNFRPEITGYINERPEWLQKFDASQNASPSPRSWQRVNAILGLGLPDNLESQAIKGQIGEAALADFVGYLRIWKDMPDSDLLLSEPDSVEVPTRPDVLYALMSALAYKATDANAENLVKFIKRIPNREFAAFGMRDTLKRKPELKKNKAIIGWVMTDGKDLLI